MVSQRAKLVLGDEKKCGPLDKKGNDDGPTQAQAHLAFIGY